MSRTQPWTQAELRTQQYLKRRFEAIRGAAEAQSCNWRRASPSFVHKERLRYKEKSVGTKKQNLRQEQPLEACSTRVRQRGGGLLTHARVRSCSASALWSLLVMWRRNMRDVLGARSSKQPAAPILFYDTCFLPSADWIFFCLS